MLVEKKYEVILMRSSMAKEKTLKENEENDEDLFTFFFRVIFFSLSSPPEKAINRKRFWGTKRFLRCLLLMAYAVPSLLCCSAPHYCVLSLTFFTYLFQFQFLILFLTILFLLLRHINNHVYISQKKNMFTFLYWNQEFRIDNSNNFTQAINQNN